MSSSSHQNFQQRGDGGCISIEQQAPNYNQVRPNSSNIITYAGTAHNQPNLFHETQKRQNKTKDDQQAAAAAASILDQKLAANFNLNQVAGKDKPKITGKPPKAMNQSMQHHGQVMGTETDHLDRSLDSISNVVSGQQNLTKHLFNIPSSTTLRSSFGTIMMDHHQQAMQPPHLSSKMQILHQEGTLASTKQTPAAQGGGDANIKGRKMDTPHLVVVKELKEQEDLDELSQIRAKGAQLLPRRSKIQEEIAVNISFLNNSGLLGQKYGAVDQDNIHAKQRESRAKSQENQYNKGRNKSKERVLASQNQALNHSKQPVQPLKIEDQSKMQSHLKKGAQPLQHIAHQRKSHQNNQRGTKSSREGAKTSLSHFNELIINNNNNKGNGEVANPINQQQQSVLNNDFKNRTHDEILIQTQPRQFQRAPVQINEQQQSRSRSREKKANQVKGSIQAVLPKSLGSHNRARNFPYPHHEPRKTSTSHAHTDVSADKKSSSFLTGNEHARCVTSQANHQGLSLNSNGRTYSQPSLVKNKGFRQAFHQPIQESDVLGPGATLQTDQTSQNHHQISTSPDQHQRQMGAGLSQNQLIEMIVKQNMLKMKHEEKMKRQISEERIKKKKEQQDTSSHICRQQQQSVNRDRAGHKKHQQIVPTLAISTIANQHSHDHNPQQTITNPSSIDYPGANPKLQNFKPAQKWNMKQIKKLNIQKLSQSQRLDFQLLNDQKNAQIKQQAVPSKIQAQLQQHRKSYGLEFIDIKKEIQREEMKTLEQKLYQQKDSIVDINTSQQLNYKLSHHQHFDHDEEEEEQVPRRLKIKQSSKQGGRIQQDTDQVTNSSQYLDTSSNGCQGHQNMRTERGGSDEQQPSVILDHSNNLALNNPPFIEANTSKVLVIKKSKIRKFMKMKKREKQKEMHFQQQSEILKTIKMQENITKLNEFCKKNLQKQLVHKKRNTVTLQQQQPDQKSQMIVNLTKISGRRLNFEQQDHHNLMSHNVNGGGQDESSCLSTEFYEEYYQAMKALKSGNQIGQSRQVHHSPTSKSLNHPTRSQNHQNTLIVSPHQEDKSANKEDNKSKIAKQSKTLLQHSGNVAVFKNQQKLKKAKTTTSKGRAAVSGQNHPPQHINLQISDHQQTLINNLISKGKHGGRSGKRERSESAPLYKHHHRKPPTSTVNVNQSSSRLNNTTLNDSSINNKKNSLNLSSSQNKDRRIALAVQENINDSSSSSKKEGGMSSIEQELLQIYLQNRHQQNLQKSESDPSTVQRMVQDQQSNSQQILLTDEDQEEDVDTVRKDDQEAYYQQQQQPPTLDYLITDAEILEDNSCSIPQDTISHIPYLKGEYDDEDEEDEEDEEEDEEEEETDNQLIIINQDPFMDDDKKIVYLSNINSCSLPQTPKQDPSSSHSQLNAEIKPVTVHPPIQSTFEYIAKKKGLILEQVQEDNQFSEKIESPMIIEEEEKHDTERSVIQNPPLINQEDQNMQMMTSEQKMMDYQMRLFTGSESIVREMKLSTPRDLKNVSNVFNELMQTGAKGTSGNKQRTLTAQHSESSLNPIQIHTRQVVLDADLGLQHQTTNTTSSHQSLFDRNSFQHFTAQKLQDMIRNNEFLNLISMRERALDYRQEKEKRYIKKLYKARQMSPRTYTQRKEQLEKWVRLEQDDIHQTKAKYQEEWDKAIQMIEETQKNVVLMREQIFTQQEVHHSAGSLNHRQIKQGEFGGFQSSRNSTASLYATQQSCHKGGERKSILEQEEYQPISHRSNRLLLSAQKPSHLGAVDIPLKTSLHSLGESTINPDLQTKPSFQVTLDEAKIAQKPQGAAAGNLIDFLEESWKKSQISNNAAPASNLSQQLNLNEVEGGNRIFIQDQNNSSSAIESSRKEDSHFSELRDKEEESSLILKNASDNHQSSNEDKSIIIDKVLVENADLSRPLARSRSQQDLTEILKKSRFEIDRENLLAQSENPNDFEEYDSINKDEESFRLMEGERQQNQNSQIVLIRKPQGNDEIKIQENLFEGSSQLQVSLKQYPQHHNTSSLNSGLLLHPEESELPSQDSLLNEHELNHYFNIDAQKKFSIEDFKQLDKRQLLQKNKTEEESEASHFDIYDDDDELVSSRSNKAKNLKGFFRDVEDGILAEEKQITLESNVSLSQEEHKLNSQRIDDAQMMVSQYLMNNYSEPELISNQPPSTSSFLFQNARPGENIKIADILRKNSLNNENNGQQQQLMHMFSIPEVVSPPQIIHQESFDSSQEREQIAFEIAEDILRMLIDEQVQIPSDFKVKQLPLFNNNDSSPEYSLIVPQRIVENDSNGTLPFSTNDDENGLKKTNPNQIPMFSNFDALELDDINVETKPQQQLQPHIVPSPQNSQNQDVYMIDTTFNEKEQRRELIDFRQRMLIESDLQRIENYINEIINTLQQHELNYLEGLSGQPHLLNDPNFHRQFLQVLTVPIKRSQLDVLNQLQTSEIGSYEHFETTMDITSHPILPVDLYLDIERQREELNIKMLSNHINGEQDIENSVIQESLHIHNKAIFDALNESLMKFRPYGIQGEPMPWSNKVRRLQTKVDTSQVDTERLFFMVKQDVMRWTSNCVGCLPSQIFIVRRQLPPNPMIQPPTDQFDDEIFQETRERRLASMLTSEVVETEHQWLNYEFEESQVKIDLSDMILEHLVDEVVQCLNNQKFQQQVRQQQNLNFEMVPSAEQFADGFYNC